MNTEHDLQREINEMLAAEWRALNDTERQVRERMIDIHHALLSIINYRFSLLNQIWKRKSMPN